MSAVSAKEGKKLSFFAVITCSSLAPPTDGVISYSPDGPSPYDYLTVATYGCNNGFGLSSGDSSRQCVSSSVGDGEWTGSAPLCESK